MKKAARSKSNRQPLETDWIFWTFRNSGQNSGQKSTGQNKSTAEQQKALKTNGFQGFDGGDKRDRTADLLNAIQALSQLSYTPIYCTPQRRPRLSASDILAETLILVNPIFQSFSSKKDCLSLTLRQSFLH